MAKKKRERWTEIRSMDNVLEFTDFVSGNIENPSGRWHEIFGNDDPLVLELGCGRGDYTIKLSNQFPGKNYLGVDIKADRLWRGARKAAREDAGQVLFFRARIEEVDQYFDENEADEIWITFPDPYPKRRHAKRRLTSPFFLQMYKRLLKPDGLVHLKTDCDILFRYTLDVLGKEQIQVVRVVADIYEEAPGDPELTISTRFEEIHRGKGKPIKYLSFSF